LGAALQADGEYEVRVYGLKHQKEERSMDHFAGLDVSVKETSVCIVDDTGKIVREVKVASEPNALLAVLKKPPTTSSGLDWKPGRCRNGFAALLPRRSYRCATVPWSNGSSRLARRIILPSTRARLPLASVHGRPTNPPTIARSRGGLSPKTLRRVQDHIAANLGQKITNQALAQVAKLSPSHFARAFKDSQGVAPHRYILECRVKRTQVLLGIAPAPHRRAPASSVAVTG
jgi:hypothetical protein